MDDRSQAQPVSVAFVERPDGLVRWAPGLALLRGRRGAGLHRDVVAGVVLAIRRDGLVPVLVVGAGAGGAWPARLPVSRLGSVVAGNHA